MRLRSRVELAVAAWGYRGGLHDRAARVAESDGEVALPRHHAKWSTRTPALCTGRHYVHALDCLTSACSWRAVQFRGTLDSVHAGQSPQLMRGPLSGRAMQRSSGGPRCQILRQGFHFHCLVPQLGRRAVRPKRPIPCTKRSRSVTSRWRRGPYSSSKGALCDLWAS